MLWIVESSLIGTEMEKKARLDFIKEVTGDKRVSWQKLSSFYFWFDYYYCTSDDGIDGVFITAHNYNVRAICNWKGIASKDVVVANTCVYVENLDKIIFEGLVKKNPTVKLYYAKQETDKNGERTNTISDVGNFGFMTSKSERILFLNRSKGITEGINKGFDLVELDSMEKGQV